MFCDFKDKGQASVSYFLGTNVFWKLEDLTKNTKLFLISKANNNKNL